jgi:hypothetical protein
MWSRLKKHHATQFSHHGAVYVIILVLNGGPWFYVGQTEDAWKRIVDGHQRPSYRSRYKRSFLYWLWGQASEVHICLPVSDELLRPGPIANIVEQWISLLFLALQPQELMHNFSAESLETLSPNDLQRGIGVREPLAQGFTFADYPMKGSPFEHSADAMKRAFFRYKRSLPVPDRAAPFLRGDLFDGHFTTHGKQSRFHLGRLQFEVKSVFIESLDIDTIWVQCDLVSPGEEHPNGILARDLDSHIIWQDPVRRLGLRIGGLRKSDQAPEWVWIRKSGDVHRWIPRLNFFVDWLDGLNLLEARPRRWYPGEKNMSRGEGTYTRHPIDFDYGREEDLFDDWDVPVTLKEYKDWYRDRE